MSSMRLTAQDYTQPVQFSTNTTTGAHWYRLVIDQKYMSVDASGNVIATETGISSGDNQVWCIIRVGSVYATDKEQQDGAQVKIYHKGTGKWLYLKGDGYLAVRDTYNGQAGAIAGDLFVMSDSNPANFEFFLSYGSTMYGRRANIWNGKVGVHNASYTTGGANRGLAIMQQGLPITDAEKAEIIPYLNSAGKGGGLSENQVANLRAAVRSTNKHITTTQLGSGLIVYTPSGLYENIRTELNALKTATASHVNTLTTGYYRIKNASRKFYDLNQVTFEQPNYSGKNPYIYSSDGSEVAWRTSSTEQDDEVWYVEQKANGKYSFRHVISGKYYASTDAAMSTSAVEGDLVSMNGANFPGHYAVRFNSTVAHAMNHNNGTGTGSDVGNYQIGGEDVLTRFATANNENYSEPSVWLFEPVNNPPGTPLTDSEKVDVRRLIWGSGKPGGIKADDSNASTDDDISKLVELWNNGNPTNPDLVRHELNRLLNLPISQRVPFENGYYRIKNGHDEFNIRSLTASLYEDATDNQPKWKTATTGNEAIYYLKNMGGNTFEVINITTGRYYNGAGIASVKTGQKAVEISPVNEAKYAGYFKIVSSNDGSTYPIDNSAHASGHGHGTGTTGVTINYHSPDGSPYDKYNFTLSSTANYPGASTWMFERVTPPNDYHHIYVKNVLNAKNVVEGFTAEQLTEFERLEDLYRAYGAGFGTAVMAEVERLVQLPKEQRIQYADGFYIIKNGSYEFYERDANKVVIMNARTDSHNVGSIGWKKKETAAAGSELDEVWYVEKQADGLYTFTNLKTLTKIQEFNHNAGYSDNAASANLAAKDMQIKLSYRPNETYHPGQFMFQTNNGGADNDITANPQGVGNAFEQGLQSGPVLAWHGSFDHHSAWMLRKVDEKVTSLETPQQKVKDNFLRSENRYGGFTTEALSNLKNITSPYRLVEEINKLRKDNTLRVATANGYVRISSAAEAYADASKKKNVYLKYNTIAGSTAGTVANGGLAWNNADRTRVDEIWMLTKSGSSTTEHTLLSPNTKKYVRDAGGVLGDAVNGNIIALDPDLFPAMFEMNFSGQTLSFLDHGLGNGTGGAMGNSRQVTDGTQSYYWAKSGTVADNINQYSTFYFEPATDLDLNVVGQFASFNYPFNVKFETALSTDHTTGVRAYRSTKVEKDRIKVVPIEGQVVTKETPVIIETDAPTIVKLAITSDAGQDFTDNVWEGSLAPKVIETDTYILIPKDREYNGNTYPAGFYPTTVASTINPNRIYITAAKGAKPTTGGQVRSFFIEMEDDTTTGIDNLEVNEAGEKAEYYDLSGRRVVKPTKGVYLTTDGRKVYINK
ncbi:MAG: hypothetical protein MSH18_03660 [Bacteroidales bacterium]|nr:hypothetical protein [Bacteroidales bacterium]